MARKNVIKPYLLASAQSLASSFQTSSTNVENIDNFTYLIETSGVTDNTGTFGVQMRFKKSDSPTVVSRWIDLTLSSVPTLADDDEEFAIFLNGLVTTEVRLTFTAAGGTPDGTADIWIAANQTGG